MDLYCPICGEPWDNDTFHEIAEEEGLTYKEVAANFRKSGCVVVGSRHNDIKHEDRANIASALYDILGDDMDGAASMLEDWEAGY